MEISQTSIPGFQAFIGFGSSEKRFARAAPNGDGLTNFNGRVVVSKHWKVTAHLAIGRIAASFKAALSF